MNNYEPDAKKTVNHLNPNRTSAMRLSDSVVHLIYDLESN
jgi:hypothetical protein